MVLCGFEIELRVVWGVLGRFGAVCGGLGSFNGPILNKTRQEMAAPMRFLKSAICNHCFRCIKGLSTSRVTKLLRFRPHAYVSVKEFSRFTSRY